MHPLVKYKELVEAAAAKYALARNQRQEESTALKNEQQLYSNICQAQLIAQQIAQCIQEQAHNQIAAVVTRSLRAVFNDPYEFNIIFERKRGRTEARLVFTRDGMEIDPMLAAGGGVVDVAAFALRLSILMLHRPPLRRLLILDEPFKFVSADYRDKLKSLLISLSKEMKIQILLITHADEFKIGKIYSI